MTNYEQRRVPTIRLCPSCLERNPMRESIVMQQKWGDGEWRLTCSDFSICDWSEISLTDLSKERRKNP